jgi:hypothetical protein
MYKIVKNNGVVICVLTEDRKTAIPLDEDNTDYQAYLAWVEEGNTAEEWSAE